MFLRYALLGVAAGLAFGQTTYADRTEFQRTYPVARAILESSNFFNVLNDLAVRAASVVPSYVAKGSSISYLGCYYDVAGTNRSLKTQPTSVNQSVETCMQICANSGKAWAGVQYGAECWCDYQPAYWQISTACTMACSGTNANTNEICGGGNANNVYRNLSMLAFDAPYTDVLGQGVQVMGCYNHTAPTDAFAGQVALPQQIDFNATTMTSRLCALNCATQGLAFSATSSGSYCFCLGTNPPNSTLIGSGSSANVPGLAGCNTPCTGNSSLACGGPSNKTMNAYLTSPLPNLAAYTDTLGQSVAALGCYTDAPGSRIFPYSATSSLNPQVMTATICQKFCAKQGWMYSGVEYGQECYCSNSVPSSTINNLFCNMWCYGLATHACGGPGAMTIYRTATTVYPLLAANYADYKGNTVSFTGCYVDSQNARLFSYQVQSINGNAMTVQACAQACTVAGYAYSGTEFGSECYCTGSLPAAAAKTQTPYCSMPCGGNTAIACGQANYLSVYSSLPPGSAAAVGNYASVISYGCSADVTTDSGSPAPAAGGTRALRGMLRTTTSVEDCVLQCSAVGFFYAGLQAGNQCWCDSALNFNTSVAASNCITACAGNSAERCGGTGYLSMYSTGYTGPTIARGLFATSLSTASYYVSCAIDSVTSRVLPYQVALPTTTTPSACIDACTSRGYPLAGVEFGSECWCGPSTSTWTNASAFDCNMPCSGNNQLTCGAGNRLSIYRNPAGAAAVSFQTTSNSYTLQGCYPDSLNSRTLPIPMYSGSGMTPDVCTNMCFGQGYNYAGVEYAYQCFCGSSVSVSSQSSAACNTPCQGAAGTFCGGGNAISIYYYSGAIRFTLQTYTSGSTKWTYQSCWGEPTNARGFPTPFNNPAGTVQACLDMGTANGFTGCGLEYGGECWCTNSNPPGGGQISESYCNMPCRGGSTQNYCGAGNVLSFYSTYSRGLTQF